MKKEMNGLKIFFILLISTIFWLGLSEFLSRIWIEYRGDSLDKAKRVLKTDEHLGWRQRENFNGSFFNIPLKTNELGFRNKELINLNDKFVILVLGPSSTFGWGVKDEETYSSIINKKLIEEFPQKKVEVINAGEIGYSSYQGLKLLNQLKKLNIKVDLVIAAYGVNDVDRYRFYFNGPLSDREEFSNPIDRPVIAANNLIGRFALSQVSIRGARSMLAKYFCQPTDAIQQRRVELDDFVLNMKAIAEISNSLGASTILLTTAYSMPRFINVNDELVKASEILFLEGKELFKDKMFKEAIMKFKQSIEINNQQNEIYYYLSSAYANLKDCSSAYEFFNMGRSTEPQRISDDIVRYNNALTNLTQSDFLFVSDISMLLNEKSIPYGDFVDPIHPSVRGHQKIANNIVNFLINNGLIKKNNDN